MNPNVMPFPRPVHCHRCDMPYVGSSCPVCKEERPSFTALKAITARARAATGAQPVGALPACRYFPKALCDCELRGTCLDAA